MQGMRVMSAAASGVNGRSGFCTLLSAAKHACMICKDLFCYLSISQVY